MGETSHTMPLCHSTLALVHTCAWEGSAGAFSADSLLKTHRAVRCWWLAYVARVPRLHHDTRIHTPLPPSFAIDSCTFNKSAEIQLLARSPLWNFISWATQEIASRSVKVVTGLLDSEEKRTHIVPLCIWLCCELLADCIMASWKHMRAPLGTVSTKRSFW